MPPARERWERVDRLLAELLVPADHVIDVVPGASAAAGLPPHEVTPLEGRLLHLLARAVGARTVLELGTLGGYSTIWLARAVGEDGRGRRSRSTRPGADPRVEATAIQTVGAKGHDGFALALVTAP